MSSKYVNAELRKELSGWKKYESTSDQEKSETLLNKAEVPTEDSKPKSKLESLVSLMENNSNVDNIIGEALNGEKDSVRFAHGVDKINPIEK